LLADIRKPIQVLFWGEMTFNIKGLNANRNWGICPQNDTEGLWDSPVAPVGPFIDCGTPRRFVGVLRGLDPCRPCKTAVVLPLLVGALPNQQPVEK